MNYEIADFCKECQKRHIKRKGYKKGPNGEKKWPIHCKGIQKKFFDSCNFNEKTGEIDVGLFDVEAEVGTGPYTLMTDETKLRYQYSSNILLWAKHKLNWTPHNPNREWYQHYQKEFLLCTSKYKVGRFSRRLGKTEILILKALHFADTFTGANPKVTIVTPFQTLVTEIFNRLKAMMDSEVSVFKGQAKQKQKPFYEISFKRGEPYNDIAYIRGFTTGASSGGGGTSIRGQKSDLLLIDEGAYLHPNDYNTILPLLEERKDMELWSFSTPCAIENNFKTWCLKDNTFKDFHYPYSVLRAIYTEEEYNDNVAKYKRSLGYIGYMLEFEAEFYEDEKKVFSEEKIISSGKHYKYYQDKFKVPNYHNKDFFIGVDWNSWKNGVNIAVLSFDRTTTQVEIVHKRIISENTKHEMEYDTQIQTEGIYRTLELFDSFEARGLCVDAGFGSLHSEVLLSALENRGKPEFLKVVDFFGTTETEHPLTGQKIKQRNKPLLVSLFKTRLEGDFFSYSVTEEGFLKDAEGAKECFPYQADRYIIERFDSKGMPIFSGPVDHYLDAIMLANFGIALMAEKAFEVDIEYAITAGGKREANQKLINELNGIIRKFNHKRFDKKDEGDLFEDENEKKNKAFSSNNFLVGNGTNSLFSYSKTFRKTLSNKFRN